MVVGIVLTPFTNAAPVPRVEVLLTGLPAGTVTVRRQADGRTFDVRGGVRISTVGGAVSVLDFEAPFQTPSVYRAEMFNPAGDPIGFSPSATTTLDVADYWIQQPLDPSLAVRLNLRGDAGGSVSRPAPGEVVWAEGATAGTWFGGRRRGVVNISLDAVTDTLEDATMLSSIFGTYETEQIPIACIRTPPGLLRIPRVLFAVIPEPDEEDMTVRFGGTQTIFRLRGTEVQPPTPGLVTPLVTWDDLAAAYPGGWSAVAAAYPDWLTASRDYSIAGLGR